MVLLAVWLGGPWAFGQTAAPPSASAVDQAIEQARKDNRADLTAIINTNMNLSADEAAKFWPRYKTYEDQRKSIGDEQAALLKDYTAHWESLTDAKAAELLARLVALEDKQTAAKRRFVGELQKVLPARVAARYYQVDSRLQVLFDLGFASQIPLIR
jgi:hypothetical protein